MNFGFNLYLLFVISWFTHLTARLPLLGAIRFDLCLVILICILIFINNKESIVEIKNSTINTILKILFFYIVITLPFVEWPGSVIKHGIESLIKAVIFYYFTIFLVNTEAKLIKFVSVFVLCQSFRIIEPLYLHLTQGYWGSFASMENWEYMNRLSGAPYDIVNPNGLAFIVLTVIPFYYYLGNVSIKKRLMSFILIPLAIYALLLTGSRSGLIGLFVIFFGVFIKSKNKIFILALICIGIAVSNIYLGANFKDRYESIFSSDTKNAVTAEGRLEGLKQDLMVYMRKPLFGHGLGTSREANANFRGVAQPSHNLYLEVAEELGFFGLVIIIALIKSIVNSSNEIKKTIIYKFGDDNYILSLNKAMQVWLLMNIIFSFASYGLTSYEWYLFAGLSVALKVIIKDIDKPEGNRSPVNNKAQLPSQWQETKGISSARTMARQEGAVWLRRKL
ncbi:O-antigen ligase family protein [Desulfopila sp. IMCC35006]|uniref:O-antigen ligase family protein n=1 Tax=Desulfopila sp. IMCC35006 TaxID=2569542 RepID=UPI0010AC61E9|nr:O-antigen ligase family protein [Desulfopila sp. IMCC35006]TKB23956.1 O-antigen ligase family protein [Desulfopila sp. IMCC35006]